MVNYYNFLKYLMFFCIKQTEKNNNISERNYEYKLYVFYYSYRQAKQHYMSFAYV